METDEVSCLLGLADGRMNGLFSIACCTLPEMLCKRSVLSDQMQYP